MVVSRQGDKQQSSKKRRRPSKRDSKEWYDDEIFMLIDMWSTKEDLFNCRDEKYQNSDNRSKTMNWIGDGLITAEIEVDIREIQEKMANLRYYFAEELRKIEASKRSGAGTASVYKPSLKFFTHLGFLQDNFTPRPTSSNLTNSHATEPTTYSLCNAPSAESTKKSRYVQIYSAEK